MAEVHNAHRQLDTFCYALVNHLTGGHPPMILGLYQSVNQAIDAFAANFELRRVENRGQLAFRAKWDTPTPWAIHQVMMNRLHAMGILHDTTSVALLFDLGYRVGYVVQEPSQKQKEAASRNEAR